MKCKAYVSDHQFRLEWLKSEWPVRDVDGIKDLPGLQFIKETQEFGKIPGLLLLNQDLFFKMREEAITETLLMLFRHKIINRLPDDIKWSLWSIGQKEFPKVCIMNEDSWAKSFPGKISIEQIARMIIDGAIDDYGHVKKIRAIQAEITKGRVFSEKLILISPHEPKVERPGGVTLIEGNHRAVAFMLEHLRTKGKFRLPDQVIIGLSNKIKKCCWYNNN